MPPKRDQRELTFTAIAMGIVLAVVLGAANVYLGLRAGMTISASIPAAVVAIGLLRGLLRRRSILEANMVQTCASAGESLAAGIIFTMPALVLGGVWTSFDYWSTTCIALSGGLLGILMMVPMRKAIVIDSPELHFPEGVACAEVLQTGAGDSAEGAESKSGVGYLFAGMAVGAAIKFVTTYLGLLQSTISWAVQRASRVFYFGMDNSPALISVGLIVGLPVAFQVFLGGALGWFVLIPIIGGAQPGIGPEESAFAVWSAQVRYVGVGAMVVGGLAAIWRVRVGIKAALTEMWTRIRDVSDHSELPSTERNLSTRTLALIGLVCVLVTGGVYYAFLQQQIGIVLLMIVVAVTLSFFFTAVASYIVGLVGNSNSPVSGMTITALLVTGGLVYALGYSGSAGILAMIGVAGIVCCVACTAGDICNDLKTGLLVGASPRNQQIIQILGVLVASFVMAPVLIVLHEGSLKAGTGGIGGQELPAPQAALFASLAEGFFGENSIPWDMVGWGVAVGIAILAVDRVLATRQSNFRMYVMPVSVGIYLPISLSTPIMVGGLLQWFIRRQAGRSSLGENRSVLIASGAIAGESLLGVLLGTLAFLEAPTFQLGDQLLPEARTALSVAAVAALCIWIYWCSRASRSGDSGQ